VQRQGFSHSVDRRIAGATIRSVGDRRSATAEWRTRWTSKSARRRSRRPKKLSNWGRWGKDDHIGTLNHVTPGHHKAAGLIKTGKVFALGIPLDREGPQTGLFGGRFNPIHQMLATGTDAIAGQQDWNKIRYADDTPCSASRAPRIGTRSATSSTRTRPATATTPS
jgi:hypothetical protein